MEIESLTRALLKDGMQSNSWQRLSQAGQQLFQLGWLGAPSPSCWSWCSSKDESVMWRCNRLFFLQQRVVLNLEVSVFLTCFR
jgi:hypothetical protein